MHNLGLLLLSVILTAPAAGGSDFAIRDGDVVVFLGDSITAERTYGKIIENYTLLRYPNRKVTFINAGVGGDTAAGGLARLQRDVFDRGATLLTVAYGINDIGWGGKADAEHRQKYLDSIRAIVQKCKEHHVRVFICSAAATAADPEKSKDDFLSKMCEEGMSISTSLGEGAIDVLGGMRQIQKGIVAANQKEADAKKHESLHVADGVHLNELGQTAMAFVILKGLGAPQNVSSATITVGATTTGQSNGCAISNLNYKANKIEFDRLDEGLPLNFGMLQGLKFRFIPIPDELNRYLLAVHGLARGNYQVQADERVLGTFSSAQLEQGVNLSSASPDPWVPGGTWDGQAWLLNMLTNGRAELTLSQRYSADYLKHYAGRAAIDDETTALVKQIETLQRHLAKPATYHFVITPAADAK
jgi:lysophospholipase L1-like esterase